MTSLPELATASSRLRRSFRRRAAFTVVELLVVCALIGLITAAALPVFKSQINSGRRNTAFFDLERICVAQENFFITYDRYAGSFNELGQRFMGSTRLGPQSLRVGDYTYTLVNYQRPGRSDGYEVVAIGNLDVSDGMHDILLVEGGTAISVPKEKRRGCVIIVNDDLDDSSTKVRR